MPRPATDKRARLTTAATALAYTRGYDATSIGDIAQEAGVAMGSVYYYFKTKDDVGRAVVDSLQARYREQLAAWEASSDPRERLAAYVDMYLRDASTIERHGCPIGSLCTELRKTSPDLGEEAAGIFRMTIAWATEQFASLGIDATQANSNALHLVTAIQGAAVLSNALSSSEPLLHETTRLKDWISATTP